LALTEITSAVNQLHNGASTQMDEARALQYHALLAVARARTNKSITNQSQQPRHPQQPPQRTYSKPHRGEGYTLRHRMELVEIFRYLKATINIDKTQKRVTANNFHRSVGLPIPGKSIAKWDKDFDKIQFDVAHGQGDKCTLSSNPVDLIQNILDKTVYEWLLEARKSNGIVSGRQLQAAADSIFHILMDDIYEPDDIPLGRTVSFTAAWRSRMTQEYGVTYCSLKGEAGS
ncbi:hypothetical protein BGX33_002897, partial [Mortierella sp. NVP41]